MAKNQPVAHLAFNKTDGKQRNKMNNRIVIMGVAMSTLALSFLLAACDHEVSKTTTRSENSYGTVKSTEKTVTQAPDGTVTRKQESTTTAPR